MKNIGKPCAGIGAGRDIAAGDNSQNRMHGLMREGRNVVFLFSTLPGAARKAQGAEAGERAVRVSLAPFVAL